MGDVIGVALTSIFCVAFFATAGYCYNQDDGSGGGIWLGIVFTAAAVGCIILDCYLFVNAFYVPR